MKKILLLLTVLPLLCSQLLLAQASADQRTVPTRIADVLALMPASDQKSFDAAMASMAATGPEAITGMAAMLSAPGKGDNTAHQYALSGYAFYVTQAGKETLRRQATDAFCKALSLTADPENKSFLLERLQVIADDNAISTLQPLLSDERLCDPAARVLVKINTDAARAAIVKALPAASGARRITLMHAVADSRSREALAVITPLAADNDPQTVKIVLHTLAMIADPSSEKVLMAAAAKQQYGYDVTNATDALLLYAGELARNGHAAQAAKIGRSLLKVPPVHTRTAALQLLRNIEGEKSVSLLTAAMDDPQQAYRAAALKLAAPFINPAATALWVKKLKTVPAPVKAEIVEMLGLNGHRAALPAIMPLLQDKNEAVQSAAITSAGKLGGESVLPALLDVMKSGNAAIVQTVQSALLTMPGDQVAAVAGKSLSAMPPAAQVSLLQVIAARRDAGSAAAVFTQAAASDATVRKAAFAALPSVVKEADLPQLFTLLDAAEDKESTRSLQDALVAAGTSSQQAILTHMRTLPAERQSRYLAVLAGIGDDASLQETVRAFDNGNAATKSAAIEALTGWKTAAAAPALLKIARDGAQADYRNAALKGYVKHVARSGFGPAERLQMLKDAMALSPEVEIKQQILKQTERCKILPALLFAGQYLDDPKLQQDAALAVMSIARTDKSFIGSTVRQLLEKSMTILSGPDSEYMRQSIRKYLSEMPADVVSQPFKLSREEEKSGYKVLFDGNQLDEWTGNKTDYVVEDGNIVIYPQRGGHGNLYTKNEYKDFSFRFEFMLTPGANNGLGVRAPLDGDAAYEGMELQILDNEAEIYKNLQPYQYHGSVYGVIPSKRGFLKPVGEWNYEEAIVKGSHVTVILNGTVIVDGDFAAARDKGTADHKEHPGLKRDKGHIGFLGHGSIVRFRNIRVKAL